MPASTEYLARRARAVRRARGAADHRRGADRARPHRPVVRVRARRACGPTSSRMAKALGNGVPIGACWARADVAAAFAPGDHATTFGGQPLAARAALAVLDVMERERRARARARAPATRLAEALPKRRRRRRRARRRAADRGRARARPRRQGRRAAVPRRGARRQRGHADARCGFAPPLLVTDAEIDDAVAIVAAACAAESVTRMSRDFLEVDDLDPGAARARCSTRASRGRPIPARSRRCSPAAASPLLFEKPSARTRISIEMAVVDPRRPPDLHPRRGGRARRARVGRGRRPHDGRHLRGDRGAGVRPPHARAHGRRRRRPGREPAVRPRASVPGAGRPADAARALRPTRRPAHRVRRRRQQRRRVARVRRRALGRRARRRVARRATSSTPTSSTGPATSAASIELGRPIPTTRCAAPTRSTPTCGRRWARRTSASSRLRAFAGFTVDDALMKARRARRACSCTACPRTAARRSRPR